MTKEKVNQFAGQWIGAWNSHDLNAILSHYADDLEFYSPLITQLNFNDTGVIRSKADLEKYFRIGLDRYPDIKFILHEQFVGVDTIVLHYTSVNGKQAAEMFHFDETGKAVKVYCHYATTP